MEESLKNSFPGVYKSVLACKALETERERNKVFKKIIQLLQEKTICKDDESPVKWRNSTLDYLMEIIPIMDRNEIMLICSNKEEFYRKFCFSPVKKKQSLYTALKQKGDNFMSSLRITRDEIYAFYGEEFELSPFELVEDGDLLQEFIERLDEFKSEPLSI